MPDFGFKISQDRQIDFDKNNRKLFLSVSNLEPSVFKCISCGSCAATCSAGQFTDFSLRKMIIQLKRGEDKAVISTISKCMLCGKCQLVCPMGVNTRNLILSIQNILKNAFHEV